MKIVLMAVLFFLTSCATAPSGQISKYQEIEAKEFVAIIGREAPADRSIGVYYAGSDDNYDYIYSRRTVMFADQDFHCYKMKRGILNLPKRYEFRVSERNMPLISNAATDAQIREALEKLINYKIK